MADPVTGHGIVLPHEHTGAHPGQLWFIVHAYVLGFSLLTLLFSIRACMVRKRKTGLPWRMQKTHAFVLGATWLSLVSFIALVLYPGLELHKDVRLQLDRFAAFDAACWLLLTAFCIRYRWKTISAAA